jgi:hypothetical protein
LKDLEPRHYSAPIWAKGGRKFVHPPATCNLKKIKIKLMNTHIPFRGMMEEKRRRFLVIISIE